MSAEHGAAQGLRVAAAPINWGVFRLDPANPDPGQILDAIAQAGYAGCELGPLGYFGADAAEVTALFAPRGLQLVSAFVAADLSRPLTEEAIGELEAVASLLAAAGSRVLLLSDAMSPARWAMAGRVEDHPETWWDAPAWRQASANVTTVRRLAAGNGLALAFHPHVGSHVESPREIRRLLEATAGAEVFLCLDSGHALIGGSDPVALLADAAERVAHVHAKDVDGAVLARLRSGELDYFAAVGEGLYADFGEGAVDWAGIAAGLARIGYAGWVVAEQDRQLSPGDPRPVVSLRRNREFLRRLLGA